MGLGWSHGGGDAGPRPRPRRRSRARHTPTARQRPAQQAASQARPLPRRGSWGGLRSRPCHPRTIKAGPSAARPRARVDASTGHSTAGQAQPNAVPGRSTSGSVFDAASMPMPQTPAGQPREAGTAGAQGLRAPAQRPGAQARSAIRSQDQGLGAGHGVRLGADVALAIEEQHPQQLAGGIKQMHRDDADGAAGPGGGREGHGREGERPGRTAPGRRRPARGPSLRGIHVSPCRTARARAGPDGVCRAGQPIRPDSTCPRIAWFALVATGTAGGHPQSRSRPRQRSAQPPLRTGRTHHWAGKSRDQGSRPARGTKAPEPQRLSTAG